MKTPKEKTYVIFGTHDKTEVGLCLKSAYKKHKTSVDGLLMPIIKEFNSATPEAAFSFYDNFLWGPDGCIKQ